MFQEPFCLGSMTFIKFSTILVGVALLLFLGEAMSLAGSEWFLISRHGECADIASLKRKVPDLGEVRDLSDFIQFMCDKGYQVTVNEVATPTGKVAEVKVPERELFYCLSRLRSVSNQEENEVPSSDSFCLLKKDCRRS